MYFIISANTLNRIRNDYYLMMYILAKFYPMIFLQVFCNQKNMWNYGSYMHYECHFIMLSLIILWCIFFSHREPKIVNDALKIKKKIWEISMNQIHRFIAHCVQMRNLTAVAHDRHAESSQYTKSLCVNLCLTVTKHWASVSGHRLRHKAIKLHVHDDKSST